MCEPAALRALDNRRWWARIRAPARFVGGLAVYLAERTVRRIRSEGDEIADVAAVLLARDPASLSAVCARLCLEPQRVARTSSRADYLWFERVPSADDAGQWAAAELEARARAAYAEARVPFNWPATIIS